MNYKESLELINALTKLGYERELIMMTLFGCCKGMSIGVAFMEAQSILNDKSEDEDYV